MKTNSLVLFHDSTILSNLSYEVAHEVLKRLSDHPATEHLTFFVSFSKEETGYSVKATDRRLRDIFLENPEKFVIELDDELVEKINED